MQFDGRAFNDAAWAAGYPLPDDEREAKRLGLLYGIITELQQGPYPKEYEKDIKQAKNILDVAAGTGQWAVDMASVLPEAQIVAVDVVPIALKQPAPSDLVLKSFDAQGYLPFPDNSFDVVNMRFATNLQNLATLEEAARVLRPGGLLNIVSLGLASFVDGSPPIACNEFNKMTMKYGPRHTPTQMGGQVSDLLKMMGKFQSVSEETIDIPMRPWSEDAKWKSIGERHREVVFELIDGLSASLTGVGAPPDEIKATVSAAKAEIDDERTQMIWKHHFIQAIRA